MFTGLRVAIVHDWLQGFHGSEPHALRERAWMFSRERFVERFSDHVAGVLNGDREPVPL